MDKKPPRDQMTSFDCHQPKLINLGIISLRSSGYLVMSIYEENQA